MRPRSTLLPALAPVALALVPLVGGGCTGGGEEPGLSAVLITVDTTNPGALDVYGKDRGLTPNLAALAAEGTVFDAAWSVAPLTMPSHASMLTGLYPPRHGVRDNGLVPLPESARTLAERASEAGYETAAFVAAVVLGEQYGLDQGFDVYDQPEGRSSTVMEHMVERDAAAVTRAAQTWLAGRDRSRPFFLWVHYFDPHAPYEPPADMLSLAGGQPYLGEVAAMDRQIGRLIETLEGEVGLDQLVLAVVADHGEALGRHGEPTHSVLCYDATQRVPLIMRRPGGEGAGERSARTASVADIHPTFIELLSLGSPGEVDGRSLFGPEEPDRGVYMESWCGYLNYGWSPLVGWVQGGFKYLHSSTPELYDLGRDPGEQANRIAEEATRAGLMRGSIEALLRLPVLERGEEEGAVGGGAGTQADMQALGYAGAASAETELPHPLLPVDRPAPATRMDELATFYQAALLAAEGRRGEAIVGLRSVVAENPLNVYARTTLAGLLKEQGASAEAARMLRDLLDEGNERFLLRLQLAQCLESTGELEAARVQVERALELQPAEAQAVELLGRLNAALGR